MKRFMKHHKWILSLLLVALIGVGATGAYLVASSGTVKNTFASGNVTTEIEENVGSEGQKEVAIKNTGDLTRAAICSKRSADIYGLHILAENINSNAENTTRFVVVAPRMELREGRNKIATCFRVPHQSGSLHEILTIFAVHGLNMVRLESRPVQGHNFEYMFFLEFTGDLNSPDMPAVLQELTQSTDGFRVFGNFAANLEGEGDAT